MEMQVPIAAENGDKEVHVVMLTGYLTKDAATGITRSGLPKVAFRLAVPKESNSHVADHVTVVGLGREFLPLKDLGKGSKVLVYGRLHQYDLPNGCGNVIIRAKKIVALQWLPPENPSGRVQELEDDRESWLGWLEAMESDDGN